MTNCIASEHGNVARSLAMGFLVGVLLGLATSLFFLMLFVAPVLGIVTAAVGLRARPPDLSRSATGAGVLLGSGGIYLLGAANTLVSCFGSTVCGGASALPFLAWAIALVAIGTFFAAVAFRRRA